MFSAHALVTQRCLTVQADETLALGVRLGQWARAGDMVACRGALGAGKTTFVQGFAAGLGVGSDDYVRSPTFALVHAYHGRTPLYHFDFYRLSCCTEVQDIGFEEYLTARGVVIVEWADKFPELLPSVRLEGIYVLLTQTGAACSGWPMICRIVDISSMLTEMCIWL
jgi:tRNA threonylcarbamoyladenosine biosynthesis protein TsaE